MRADGKGGGEVIKAASLCSFRCLFQTKGIAVEATLSPFRFLFSAFCHGEKGFRIIFPNDAGHFAFQRHLSNEFLLFFRTVGEFCRRGDIGVIVINGNVKVMGEILQYIKNRARSSYEAADGDGVLPFLWSLTCVPAQSDNSLSAR